MLIGSINPCPWWCVDVGSFCDQIISQGHFLRFLWFEIWLRSRLGKLFLSKISWLLCIEINNSYLILLVGDLSFDQFFNISKWFVINEVTRSQFLQKKSLRLSPGLAQNQNLEIETWTIEKPLRNHLETPGGDTL